MMSKKYLASPIGSLSDLLFSDIPQELWGKQTEVVIDGQWSYFANKVWNCNEDYLRAHFRLDPLKGEKRYD